MQLEDNWRPGNQQAAGLSRSLRQVSVGIAPWSQWDSFTTGIHGLAFLAAVRLVNNRFT